VVAERREATVVSGGINGMLGESAGP
jgi:hypothetical protein